MDTSEIMIRWILRNISGKPKKLLYPLRKPPQSKKDWRNPIVFVTFVDHNKY